MRTANLVVSTVWFHAAFAFTASQHTPRWTSKRAWRMCSEPTVAGVASTRLIDVASRAADALSHGRAHIEPGFLSGTSLEAARADMLNVYSQVAGGESGDFDSIQTSLLDPEFRRTLPGPCPFSSVLDELDELRVGLAQCTGRSLLEGGGLHLMHYPVGSKFMRHVDEDPTLYEPRRNSISFLIYLTPDDWTDEDGGALCIYDPQATGTGAGTSEARVVLPVGGTLVIYDSTVEHEVLQTRRPRHLISGRFRELDEDWQQRRSS